MIIHPKNSFLNKNKNVWVYHVLYKGVQWFNLEVLNKKIILEMLRAAGISRITLVCIPSSVGRTLEMVFFEQAPYIHTYN